MDRFRIVIVCRLRTSMIVAAFAHLYFLNGKRTEQRKMFIAYEVDEEPTEGLLSPALLIGGGIIVAGGGLLTVHRMVEKSSSKSSTASLLLESCTDTFRDMMEAGMVALGCMAWPIVGSANWAWSKLSHHRCCSEENDDKKKQ